MLGKVQWRNTVADKVGSDNLTVPRVSVVIPAYNAAQFVGATISSVLAQTFGDLEIIVIDDGSTDHTASVVASFEKAQYHHQPNRGPAAARNAGLRRARGEYVAFLDADDVWAPEMLDACVSVLDSDPEIGVVHTNWRVINATGKVVQENSGWRPWRGQVFDRLLIDIPMNTSTIVWRKRCYDDIGGFDETPEINDDWYNWLRIAHQGWEFECIPEPLVCRRRHGNSLTQAQNERVIRWRFRALDKLCNEVPISPELRNKAYARVHWIATLNALRRRSLTEATDHFNKAVQLTPELLDERSTYFALAAAHENASSDKAMPTETSVEDIRSLLTGLFALAELPDGLRNGERRFFSFAHFCLAQMAYGASTGDLGCQSREYMLESLLIYPRSALMWQRWPWYLRVLVGRKAVHTLSGQRQVRVK